LKELRKRMNQTTTKSPDPPEWITTTEAAELTGYARAYFRQLIQRGRLHQVEKRGRDWFLSKDEVLAYSKKMKELGSAKHDPWGMGARQSGDKAE